MMMSRVLKRKKVITKRKMMSMLLLKKTIDEKIRINKKIMMTIMKEAMKMMVMKKRK